MAGGFGQCRFHSKHVALRKSTAPIETIVVEAHIIAEIKAIEEGVFSKPYTL